MPPPRLAHLTGTAMWQHCDYDHARLAAAPARVMLARLARSPAAAADPAPWLRVRGAAVVLPNRPDVCADATVLLADPERGLQILKPGGWEVLPAPYPRVAAPSRDALEFAPPRPSQPPPPAVGVARDPAGRVWLLDRAPARLRELGPDLRLLDTLPLEGVPSQVAASAWCVAVSDGARLHVQSYGGSWQTLALPDTCIALAADCAFDLIVLLLPGPRLAILRPDGLLTHTLPELTAPLFLVVTGNDAFLAGEPGGEPGTAAETRFSAFTVDAAGVPTAGDAYAVRGFDGRALWRQNCTVHASAKDGQLALYPDDPPGETEGTVETFALDSTIFACAWHRLFIDACLPSGTSITVEARTADDLPPQILWRQRRPPANMPDLAGSLPNNDSWPPLGSLQPDEPGWWPVGVLDPRGPLADVPDPPERIDRPSDEPMAKERSHAGPPWPQVTLEGLIKAPPGRYLWLRLRLTGTKRSSPAVLAVRATFPRPSLLDLLPAYWRADQISAVATDQALALFEGWFTEANANVTALPQLADPRLVPPEALDWLASYVALVFDGRITEAVRRQLLAEICALYQQRGTVPGLARLLSILARDEVTIVEGFRLRRRSGTFLGVENNAIAGPGLQLGGEESDAADDPADAALINAHAALMLRRAAIRAGKEIRCPADDPPWPMETDPDALFVRRFAHRFTVVLPCRRTDTLAAIIEAAIETNKPAHTLHRLCWFDAGFQIGAASLVGLARLGETPCFDPGILGAAVLGKANTLGRGGPEPRFGIGQRLNRDRMATQ
jgi:phage tail-like protein